MPVRKEYVTKPRNLILDYVITNKNRQFSAADINEYLQKENCQINLATVYRNLDKLSEEGTLLRYKYADSNFCLYQYADAHENCQNHLHMKCQECGKVMHLECEFMDEITKHLLEHHGFDISCKGSMLTGTCKECNNANNQLTN